MRIIDPIHIGLIGELNKIRKTRNDIIHRGFSVTEDEVQNAIGVIGYYIFHVGLHIREQE